MSVFIAQYLPNVQVYWSEIVASIGETFAMLIISGSVSFIIGLLLGTLMVVTRPGGIWEKPGLNLVLSRIIDIFRSIPIVILIGFLYPVTRFVMGTTIQLRGALFPLVVGCVPFFSRQIEMALSSVNSGLIEAAQSMGTSRLGIIIRVYWRESIPAIVRSTTITLISLIGLIATVGGAIGAGGVGSVAIRYGYNRHMQDISLVCVIIVLVFVSVIQLLGDIVIRKTTH